MADGDTPTPEAVNVHITIHGDGTCEARVGHDLVGGDGWSVGRAFTEAKRAAIRAAFANGIKV